MTADTLDATHEQTEELHPPESGFSINWTMNGGYGEQVQITMRGNEPYDWPVVLKERRAMLEAAQKNGWTFGKPMPAPNATAPTPPSVGNGHAPVPPPPAVVAPAGPSESACAMIEIGTSYSGGKPQLAFHVNGLDKPLRYTQDVSKMAALLAPLGFTAAHIVVGQKYPVNCIVTWRQGEKYRDVLSVRPA